MSELDVMYVSDKDGVRVTVGETRDPQPGRVYTYRHHTRDFGKSAKAEDDGLIFVHAVNHGEIKPDSILPPWGD